METKKYYLTKETQTTIAGIKLFRIKALKSFSIFNKGELGGYIESEKNLSQDGNAWVYGDARVSGDAWVSGDARVSGDAWVYGDARVYGDAWVSGGARVSGDARICCKFNFKETKTVKRWIKHEAKFKGD
jgi:hypothetical protein